MRQHHEDELELEGTRIVNSFSRRSWCGVMKMCWREHEVHLTCAGSKHSFELAELYLVSEPVRYHDEEEPQSEMNADCFSFVSRAGAGSMPWRMRQDLEGTSCRNRCAVVMSVDLKEMGIVSRARVAGPARIRRRILHSLNWRERQFFLVRWHQGELEELFLLPLLELVLWHA